MFEEVCIRILPLGILISEHLFWIQVPEISVGFFEYVGAGFCADRFDVGYSNFFYYSDAAFENNDEGVAACVQKCELSMIVGFLGVSVQRTPVSGSGHIVHCSSE